MISVSNTVRVNEDGERVVLTRDAKGAVRGFSALCTHQGCSVSSVGGGAISCPCHGSRFTPYGEVITGPATKGLDKIG